MIIAALAMTAVACGPGVADPVPPKGALTVGSPSALPPVPGAPQVTAGDPEHLTFDAPNDRIFTPGVGWMPSDRFWHLYEHELERLPSDLDLAAVSELRRARLERASDHPDDSAPAGPINGDS